ncbi:MAG: transposase [Bacteroidota bacterium]
MIKKRRQYSPEFKAKVAISAIRGEESTADLAKYYRIHPTLLNNWKRHLIENASQLFVRGKAAIREVEIDIEEVDELYRQIGKLTVERDLLAGHPSDLGISADSVGRHYLDQWRH